jgi:mono/diheme cytochrome c family protein
VAVMRRFLVFLAAAAASTLIISSAFAVGNPVAGKKVYAANGCGGCHTFKAAGSTGKVGPALTKASMTAHAKSARQALVVFVRASVVAPNAYVAKGQKKGIMPSTYGKSLSKKQLDDLVAFLAKG